MRRRHRPTGCAKFLIVLLIVAPLAFVGTSLYRGENPIDNLLALFGQEKQEVQNVESIQTPASDVDDCQKRIQELEAVISRLQKENDSLKRLNKD